MKLIYFMLLFLPMTLVSADIANADMKQFRNDAMDVLDHPNCRKKFKSYLKQKEPKAFIFVAREGQVADYCYSIKGHKIEKCHNRHKPNTPCQFFARDHTLLLSRPDLGLEPIDKNLFYMAERYGVDEVKNMVETGVDLNQQNERGYTPLLLAVLQKDLEVIEYLVSKGADLELKNKEGDNPLIIATERKYKDIVAYLLSQGADITSTTRTNKMQAVHIAATHRKTDLLDIIVSKGADINAQDKSGKTPLDWANYNRRKKVIEYLLEKGAKSGDSL